MYALEVIFNYYTMYLYNKTKKKMYSIYNCGNTMLVKFKKVRLINLVIILNSFFTYILEIAGLFTKKHN